MLQAFGRNDERFTLRMPRFALSDNRSLTTSLGLHKLTDAKVSAVGRAFLSTDTPHTLVKPTGGGVGSGIVTFGVFSRTPVDTSGMRMPRGRGGSGTATQSAKINHMVVDRPFFASIVDARRGVILMAGAVYELPSQPDQGK